MRDEVNTFVSPADLVVDEVAALEGFRIWVSLSNGVAGELDLAAIAKSPWFQRWQDRSLFESVRKTAGGRNIVWGDDSEESDLVFLRQLALCRVNGTAVGGVRRGGQSAADQCLSFAVSTGYTSRSAGSITIRHISTPIMVGTRWKSTSGKSPAARAVATAFEAPPAELGARTSV